MIKIYRRSPGHSKILSRSEAYTGLARVDLKAVWKGRRCGMGHVWAAIAGFRDVAYAQKCFIV
ncbi:hypothetical protein NQ318_011074 [Aromia moschata]|uniref:Uncharacterized protein n=1 Tax=Aromia moschata TaxID=1265417 RepID=A0AAV8YTM7_9CUCU|nr:hypothetical protein NQ318_011074 [Aromia moschata]